MKVVINNCYGGFGVSPFGLSKFAERKGMKLFFYEQDYEASIYNRLSVTKANKSYHPIALTKDVGKVLQSDEMYAKYADLIFRDNNIERHDSDLVFLIETYGKKMNDGYSELKVVEIPDDVDYEIQEYDGNEWVAEKHRTWS